MKAHNVTPADLEWTCRGCGRALEARKVAVEYMGNRFTTELPTCPGCGFVMISEELALGKMAEVEQILEDK